MGEGEARRRTAWGGLRGAWPPPLLETPSETWVRVAEVMRKKGARDWEDRSERPQGMWRLSPGTPADAEAGPHAKAIGINDRSHRAWQPWSAPLSTQGSAGRAWRVPGGGSDARGSPRAPAVRGGGPHRPLEMAPRGGLAATSPWGAELPALHQPLRLWPLLKPAEPLAASPASPAFSPQHDGFGTELCLQVQVLRDLVRHPDTAAATHHSGAHQGQLHRPAAPGTPGYRSHQRAPNAGHGVGAQGFRGGHSSLRAQGARWEVSCNAFQGAPQPWGLRIPGHKNRPNKHGA